MNFAASVFRNFFQDEESLARHEEKRTQGTQRSKVQRGPDRAPRKERNDKGKRLNLRSSYLNEMQMN